MNKIDATAALETLMSDISEECFCAGWIMGNGHGLWRLANARGGNYGQGSVSPDQAERLLELAGEAGVWLDWDDDLVQVPLEDWKSTVGVGDRLACDATGKFLHAPARVDAWRGPETGRAWPEHCSLSTETLDGEDYDHAVDLVMTDRGSHLPAMHADDRNGLLARALATIQELRREVATDDLLLEDRDRLVLRLSKLLKELTEKPDRPVDRFVQLIHEGKTVNQAIHESGIDVRVVL